MRCKKATKSRRPEGGRSEAIAREAAGICTSDHLLCIFTAECTLASGLRNRKVLFGKLLRARRARLRCARKHKGFGEL